MQSIRKIYFISDGTGITAESLGQSLLTQFDGIEFDTETLPFVNTITKAEQTIQHILQTAGADTIIFSTLVDEEIRQLFQQAPFLCLDLFNSFISPLEKALAQKSSHTIGKTHGVTLSNYNNYMLRMNAVNYVLANDDGSNIKEYTQADVILIGVSRSGKTPTCLYLAMQFGVYAANYPITSDEPNMRRLPTLLEPFKSKAFGLTIEPTRLNQIRQERRPGSQYATVSQCQYEVREVEAMYEKEKISHINVTNRSIEEIAAEIMIGCKLKRRLI